MNEASPRAAPPREPASGDLARLRIPRGREIRGFRGFPFLTVSVLVGLGGLLWLFREPLLALVESRGAPAVTVGKAVRVAPGAPAEGDVSANGYVYADRTTSVATVLSGRLVELHAQEGDVVPAGTVVARIQYDDLEAAEAAARERTRGADARAAEAEAALGAARLDVARLAAQTESLRSVAAQARETAERLARDVGRNRALFEKRWIEADEWDRIQTEARTAAIARDAAEARVRESEAAAASWQGEIARREAALAVARTEVDSARIAERAAAIEVEKTRIRAPFDGLVIRKDAEVGEVVAPTGAGGRGSVFTIVDPTSFEVQVDLSERRIARVAEGDRATIFLDADPDTGHPGRVRKIWPRADKSKGTIEVRVAFDARPATLRPEMAARVVFQGKAAGAPAAQAEAPYVTVPARAVVRRGPEAEVLVVSGGRVARRTVTLGERRGEGWVVLAGLEGGESVVLDPPPGLADGQEVRAGASP